MLYIFPKSLWWAAGDAYFQTAWQVPFCCTNKVVPSGFHIHELRSLRRAITSLTLYFSARHVPHWPAWPSHSLYVSRMLLKIPRDCPSSNQLSSASPAAHQKYLCTEPERPENAYVYVLFHCRHPESQLSLVCLNSQAQSHFYCTDFLIPL